VRGTRHCGVGLAALSYSDVTAKEDEDAARQARSLPSRVRGKAITQHTVLVGREVGRSFGRQLVGWANLG
jgi:hypothetical protein